MGIGAIGSIAGGLISSRGASRAAAAQTAAANRQLDLQERIYEENVGRFQPYEQGGQNALSALMYELGLGNQPTFGGSPMQITEIPGSSTTTGGFTGPGGPGSSITGPNGQTLYFGSQAYEDAIANGGGQVTASPARYSVGGQVFDTREQAQAYADANPTGGTQYGGYEASQGHQLRTREGLNAIDASAAARGGLYSGATLQALERGGQEYAQLGYDNFLNRLTGLASSGQNAAGQGAAAGANYAQGASNALDNIGNAQSAGAIGQANAWNNAIGNGIGMWQYQNSLAGQGGGNTGGMFGNALFGQGQLFGGNSWG